MTRSCGCPCPGSVLQRVGDGDVQGGIKPTGPVREEHVSRPSVVAGEKSSTLLEWRKASSRCRIMEGIPHSIVSYNALTACAADHAVVTQGVTVLAAARAGTWLVINWEAQPELAGNNKLGAAEVETEGRKRGAVEPNLILY